MQCWTQEKKNLLTDKIKEITLQPIQTTQYKKESNLLIDKLLDEFFLATRNFYDLFGNEDLMSIVSGYLFGKLIHKENYKDIIFLKEYPILFKQITSKISHAIVNGDMLLGVVDNTVIYNIKTLVFETVGDLFIYIKNTLELPKSFTTLQFYNFNYNFSKKPEDYVGKYESIILFLEKCGKSSCDVFMFDLDHYRNIFRTIDRDRMTNMAIRQFKKCLSKREYYSKNGHLLKLVKSNPTLIETNLFIRWYNKNVETKNEKRKREEEQKQNKIKRKMMRW